MTKPDKSTAPEGFSESSVGRQSLSASDAIIEISADAIISIDAEQRIIRFNHGAEIIFGYRASELLGRPLDMLLPERYRGAHGGHVFRFGAGDVAARRMGERRQIAGLRASGEEFPAEASISRLDIDGERMYTVVLRDISERQRAEQVQRFLAQAGELLAGSLEAERTLESVAQLAVPLLGDWCVIFAVGADGSIRRELAVHSDPARKAQMQQLLKIPFHGSTSHPVTLAVAEARSSCIELNDDPALESIADDAAHLKILRELRPRSLIAVPMKARNRVLGALCFFQGQPRSRSHSQDDLELAEELARRAALALDNARLYAEATSAVRARDDVLAVVSHDLGNPLSAIRIASGLLLRKPPAERVPAEDRKQLEGIRASVDQMERLIRDLLDVKRIEAGLLSLEYESCSVSAMMHEVAEAAEQWIEGKSLRIAVDTDEALRVHADPQRILQVFSNLVGNAARFAIPGSAIKLTSRGQGRDVVFSVSDSGPGIPAEHLPHLFDRFWQASRTGRHGIGLGLAIVKGIVEAHGGRVWAESELGAGSTFFFTLPPQDATP